MKGFHTKQRKANVSGQAGSGTATRTGVEALYSRALPATRSGDLYRAFPYPTKKSRPKRSLCSLRRTQILARPCSTDSQEAAPLAWLHCSAKIHLKSFETRRIGSG